MYNDKLVYKLVIWVFFGIRLWKKKVALISFLYWIWTSLFICWYDFCDGKIIHEHKLKFLWICFHNLGKLFHCIFVYYVKFLSLPLFIVGPYGLGRCLNIGNNTRMTRSITDSTQKALGHPYHVKVLKVCYLKKLLVYFIHVWMYMQIIVDMSFTII